MVQELSGSQGIVTAHLELNIQSIKFQIEKMILDHNDEIAENVLQTCEDILSKNNIINIVNHDVSRILHSQIEQHVKKELLSFQPTKTDLNDIIKYVVAKAARRIIGSKHCFKCNCINKIDAVFCRSCGYKFKDPFKICECGNQIYDNPLDQYCDICGVLIPSEDKS